MRRILFVDDDQNVLKQFKKVLHPMSRRWEMEFVSNTEEALNLLSESFFDVVVSDMHMPEMDGVKLLGIVRERYPATARIILSAHPDRETVLKSVESAHQFLMKPCDAETIKYTIERTCKLKDLLRNETLVKTITGIKDLPSIPSLYGLIVKEMQSPDASLKKVGHIISQDISMSAKILQFVNSAFFGLPRKIIDPQQAAVYLGIETLKALVLSIHVFSSFSESSELCGFSLSDMWKHSLLTGKLAKEIVHAELEDKTLAEEALIAGLLHDIGKLIMLKIPEQYMEVKDYAEKTGCNYVDAEYAVMKTSHAELGAYLLGLWGLPDDIVETVAFHHSPSKLMDDLIFITNKPSNMVGSNEKSKDDDLKSQLNKNLLMEFTILTAVHLANALMMQKHCFSDDNFFPHVDMLYIRILNLKDKLPKWAERCNRLKQEEI